MATERQLADQVMQVAHDAEAARLRGELSALRKKYRVALDEITRAKAAVEVAESVRDVAGKPLPAKRARKKKPQATVVLALSDLHVEERVRPEEVRGLNDYDLAEAHRRIGEVTRRSKRLIEHEQALTDIRRIVLWLGGDMISGHIHDELIESSQLAPLAAIRWVAERIKTVIDEIAAIGPPVVIVTSSGNHGRSTEKRRISGENDHSFEQHLYHTMAATETRKNVTWRVSDGYHNIVDLDGFVVRFHHGHAMRGGGGFGGLVPSANKLIAGWNASQPVDLDIFGHLHQFTVSRKFVANGSLIGPSPYGDRLGFPADPPCQAMVVIDHRHNRVTKAIPVFVD